MSGRAKPKAFDALLADHAIESASFSLSFSRQFDDAALQRIVNGSRLWRDHLPAIGGTFFVDRELSRSSIDPGARSLEFAYLRPDGTPTWIMRVAQNEVTVETTRYTRWAQVWGFVESRFREVAGCVSDIDGLTIIAAGLQFVDKFICEDGEYNLRDIFKASSRLPDATFSQGLVWHCHTGWFEKSAKGNVLNQLFIDATRLGESDGLRGYQISIRHFQQLRLLAVQAKLKQGQLKEISEEMDILHGVNKSVLGDILVEKMQERIALSKGVKGDE